MQKETRLQFPFSQQSIRIAFSAIFLMLLFICNYSAKSQTLYHATGKASFYAKRFEGHKTSSGEIFSNSEMTAAHRSLPFGTMVRVTNLTNGKSVIVRINDRGPFIFTRLIDLSQAAADSLGFKHSGTTRVSIEEINLPPVDTSGSIAPKSTILYDSTLLQFPQDWIGEWEGTLKYFSPEGLTMKTSVQLSISPAPVPDSYRWIIKMDSSVVYRELVVHPNAENQFSLDEKNGINIPCFLLGNHFFCRYQKNDSMFEADYALLSDRQMTFQLTAGPDRRSYSTGNVLGNDDLVPIVNVFKLNMLQTAVLHRKQ